MSADARQRAERRRREAFRWPVRRYARGDEPIRDPLDRSSVDERVALVWELTLEMWALTGRPMPTYPRAQAPGTISRGPRR